MASQAIGYPFDTTNGGRGSISVEVVSRGIRGVLRSRKAVAQLFARTNDKVQLDRGALWRILMQASEAMKPDTGVTRHTAEREVQTAKGDRITIKVSVWLNGVTDPKVGAWVAGVMTLVMQNDDEPPTSPKSDDTLGLGTNQEPVLCGGVLPPRYREVLVTGEEPEEHEEA